VSHALATAQFHLRDESDTARFGALIAHALLAQRARIEAEGLFLALSGDLGAGKTALVRACLRELGVEGPVKSPTFTLLEPYVVSSLNFYHFDFYRFGGAEEFTNSGFRELFGPGNICAVEWPERAVGALPTPDLDVTLNVAGEGRDIALLARSEGGVACLQDVRTGWMERGADNAGA
jgi:tRNA threonylcarbamoyladenosine biosynthesis protein TsaE